MKKILLFIAVVTIGYTSFSQVVCAGIAPGTIAGNYDFTWADPAGGDWACPDFLIPGTFIQGDLMVADDGTSLGLSAQGVPLENYGCIPLVNDLTGKIAVVYRYDGINASTSCEFGVKALACQDAGAIGVIIVNRETAVASMGGGAQGINVTIPVVMLSDVDGALLRAEMLNGPVNMFIGNKTGLYADDAGVTAGTTLISKSGGVLSQLSQNASEFNFEIGTSVFNYGSNDQTGIIVTANIDGPGGASVYNEVAGPLSIISGDTLDIYPGEAFNFPQFSLASYPAGRYTLTYTVALTNTDEYLGDNVVTTDFVINDSIFSYAQLDPVTNLPMSDNGYRPSTNTATYSICSVISDPNASRIGVSGLYFSASTGSTSGVVLTGEEMALNLYKWEDVFVDLNDAGLLFDNLTNVAFGFYQYTTDAQGEMVYGEFETPVLLTDNQRYLACVQTVNLSVYLGHHTGTNYLWNEGTYLQPMFPVENDAVYSAGGFGADTPSSLGIKVFNAAELSIEESSVLEGIAYPNPATNLVTVSLDAEGAASLTVTDVAGKVALNNKISLVNGKSEVNISSLEAGMYIFNITLENGKTSQFNVVKK